jgi:hypothetical protein
VWVPTFINDTQFGWTDPAGLPLDGRPFSVQSGLDADVTLYDGEGRTLEARRLSHQVQDVPVRVPLELPLSLPVTIAPQGLVIPYRILVTAEHLRESVDITDTFRIAPPDTSCGVIRSP